VRTKTYGTRAAGEPFAVRQITHRPQPDRVYGLHARIKAHITILQTKTTHNHGEVDCECEYT
jgi:hypothetical protein